MRIKWKNFIALILMGLFVYIVINVTPIIKNIFEEIDEVYTYGPGRMVIKFLFFGLICITLVAIAKFMSRR